MADSDLKGFAGIASLQVALGGAAFFSSALPSLFTIRRFPDRYTQKDIRDGEIIATVQTLSVGGIASAMVDNKAPLLLAAGICVMNVAMYEYALATARGRATSSINPEEAA